MLIEEVSFFVFFIYARTLAKTMNETFIIDDLRVASLFALFRLQAASNLQLEDHMNR